MDMSFQEKSTWISLVSTLAIFGYYFYNVAGLHYLQTEDATAVAVWLLVKAIVLVTIVEAFFHGMLAMANRRGAEMGPDERERLIELKGNKNGYAVLSTGVIICVVQMIMFAVLPEMDERKSSLQIPMLTAHMLMFSFIVAEVVRFTTQIVLYRRGA